MMLSATSWRPIASVRVQLHSERDNPRKMASVRLATLLMLLAVPDWVSVSQGLLFCYE